MGTSALDVLIVDDSADLATLLQVFFEKVGIQAQSVQSLGEARLALINHRIRFVVLDLVLADGNGQQLLPYISEKLSYVPEIIVSSGNIPKVLEQNSQISKVFVKPYPFRELVAYVKGRIES